MTLQRSPVQFLFRAHAWAVALPQTRYLQEASDRCFSHTSMSLSSLSPSPPLSLKINVFFKKSTTKYKLRVLDSACPHPTLQSLQRKIMKDTLSPFTLGSVTVLQVFPTVLCLHFHLLQGSKPKHATSSKSAPLSTVTPWFSNWLRRGAICYLLKFFFFLINKL